MHFFVRLALVLAGLFIALPAASQAPADQTRKEQMLALLKSLHPVTGDVKLPGASAMLHLGKDYYYLPPDEAKRVIVDGWGNPPETGEGTMGIVFPAGSTFLDDVWGAVITYDPSGWVSDEDAATTDYDALLSDLKQGMEQNNEARREAGYPEMHLVGWAQPPVYDPNSHSVVWARNTQFPESPENSLNYDVRLLGRNGVLSLNMVTGMSALDSTRAAAKKFAASAEFTPGARYADYQPGVDKKAEYGIGGLIAAGAGLAVAKKLGLIGIILAFGKKFLILILALFGGLGAWLRKLFGRNKAPEAEEYYEPLPFEQDEPEVAEEAPPASEAEPETGLRPAE